jgi:hypothetical protein
MFSEMREMLSDQVTQQIQPKNYLFDIESRIE